jgi:hypothetical protein
MGKKFIALLQREPTAVGALVGAVVPSLVLLGAVHLDDKAIAALIVAVNAVMGFVVRLVVTPTTTGPQTG